MKRFRFAYERVLAWRDQQAQISRNRLEVLLATRQNVQQARSALRSEAAVQAQEHAGSSTISAESLHVEQLFLRNLAQLDRKLGREEHKLDTAIARQRVLCQDYTRSVRLLELLEAKELRDWKQAYERECEIAAGEAWPSRRNLGDPNLL